MRFLALPGLILLAFSLTACGAQASSASPTAAASFTAPQPSPSATPELSAPTDTPAGPLGSISGSILPPEEAQPATAIRIYARQKSTAQVFSTEIPLDQLTYTISGLPMGTYTVFAWYYPDGAPGAYNSAGVGFASTSSEQLKCSNSLIEIVLTEARPDFQGADISCWAGDYFIYLTPIP